MEQPIEILEDKELEKYYFVYPHYKKSLLMPQAEDLAGNKIENYCKQMIDFLNFGKFF